MKLKKALDGIFTFTFYNTKSRKVEKSKISCTLEYARELANWHGCIGKWETATNRIYV